MLDRLWLPFDPLAQFAPPIICPNWSTFLAPDQQKVESRKQKAENSLRRVLRYADRLQDTEYTESDTDIVTECKYSVLSQFAHVHSQGIRTRYKRTRQNNTEHHNLVQKKGPSVIHDPVIVSDRISHTTFDWLEKQGTTHTNL